MVNGYFFVLPPMEMEKFPSKRVAPALTVRMALGALIIKEKLGLTDIETVEMIKARSRARGLSEREYMAGNLLQVEVSAEDVAEAFVHQALETKTTRSIVTVDGGNIAAALNSPEFSRTACKP
jgi:hypothetical protein